MKDYITELLIEDIGEEIDNANKKYGNFNSTHEVYGVLAEEVDEFWDLVRLNTSNPIEWKSHQMVLELKQIAAVAIRAIEQIENNQIKWV